MTDLIRIEDVLDDPITGTHVKFIKLGPDGFVVEQTIVPHKTKSTLNHFHKSWTETFEIISGVCSCNVAGQVYNGGPGDVFVARLFQRNSCSYSERGNTNKPFVETC